MTRYRGSTANFSERAEPRTGASQVVTKETMGRETFRRKHSGQIGRGTEFAAQDTIDHQLLQEPDKQLRWLRLVEQKAQSQRGFVPRMYYEELADAFYKLDGVVVQISSNTEARHILDELIADAEARAEELKKNKSTPSSRDKDVKVADELALAEKVLKQLEKSRKVPHLDVVTLLRVYEAFMGHPAQQKMLQDMRREYDASIARLARAVRQHLEVVDKRV